MPNVLKIILIVLLVLVVAIAVGAYLLYRSTDKKTEKFRVIGDVIGWQQGHLPWFGRACIDYTRKGKHFQAMTRVMRKSKQPKMGAKLLWEIHVFHIPDKPALYLAYKPKKNTSAAATTAAKSA